MLYDTYLLSQDNLVKAGINLDAMGITNRKNRPYMVVASNRQMTWLVPLTTMLKQSHGRVTVIHHVKGNEVTCEAITSDMFSVSTDTLHKIGMRRGKIEGGKAVTRQLQYSLECGRLGRYPQ